MQSKSQQRTLAAATHIRGTGFWSGQPVSVSLHPALAGSGICFYRVDLPGSPKIRVSVEAVQPTQFRTRLSHGMASVDMTEHLMSALYAAGVDNCRVECDAQELPALDGSALGYLQAIDKIGTVAQAAESKVFAIQDAIRIGDDRNWIIAMPSDDQQLHLEYRLDYGPGSVIAPSSYKTILNQAVFAEQIAAARTFVTQNEALHIRSLGLAEHVSYSDLLVFDENGPIDNELRYQNECARHKLLDLIGDLALSGLRISGRIIASRSGHALNAKMASAILKQYNCTNVSLAAA